MHSHYSSTVCKLNPLKRRRRPLRELGAYTHTLGLCLAGSFDYDFCYVIVLPPHAIKSVQNGGWRWISG